MGWHFKKLSIWQYFSRWSCQYFHSKRRLWNVQSLLLDLPTFQHLFIFSLFGFRTFFQSCYKIVILFDFMFFFGVQVLHWKRQLIGYNDTFQIIHTKKTNIKRTLHFIKSNSLLQLNNLTLKWVSDNFSFTITTLSNENDLFNTFF